MTGKSRERQWDGISSPKPVAEHQDIKAFAAAELERVLRDHSQRRRQLEHRHQSPTILLIGLAVVSVLFVVGWLMLDRMRCDAFYSDAPRLLRHLTCP